MSKSDQDFLMEKCNDAATGKPYAPFCDKVRVLGDANK